MAARARIKGVGISAKKMRKVCDLVRGKDVDVAADLLRFTQTPSAAVLLKTINAAAANAENNELMNRANLRIVEITADIGPRMRRYRPKARGRVGSFDRPTCHVTVVVDEVIPE